jgi:hypothetical protein
MKKVILSVILFAVFSGFTIAKVAADSEKVKKAITETALNYIEGWYSGDAERMDKAMHKDLAKRGIMVNAGTGKTGIMPATKDQMVAWTKAGAGKKAKEKWGIKVEILDVLVNTASVKITSVDFIDYAHLAKFDGEWKILNVIWEFPPKK